MSKEKFKIVSLPKFFLARIIILPVTFILFLVVVGLSINTYYKFPMLYVVTDPSDSQFQAEDFRFEYYKNLQETLDLVFPVGTPKEFVDKILVGHAGATVWTEGKPDPDIEGGTWYHYHRSNLRYSWITLGAKGGWGCTVRIVYDKNQGLIMIKVGIEMC